ncbi:MAG: Uma2 family endonuclease [Gemmataceae bacterium]|nr:Uma2 family endonuclease [Gemmataceae bacterium]
MNPDVPATADDVVYPDSDGQPMADNTLQWDWMVKIVGELREQFAGQPVFVAGDLLWYPVKGDNKTRTAPDALVAFGRPPGYRGSYRQWEEGGVAPQVVFEVLSPGNTREELRDKLRWYDRFGVEEYYLIDPYKNRLFGWVRGDGRLESVVPMDGFVSPRLGVRFEASGEVKLFAPDGHEFRTREERVEELAAELAKTASAFEEERARAIEAEREARLAHERAEHERQRAEHERQRAEAERQRAEAERADKDALILKLRELGVNADDVLKPAG